jgi:sensor histidine kinase regulating citrate/malate metabolism
MKKKILGGIAIVAIAVAVAFNVSISNQKQDKASMLALANVEVLAEAETTKEKIDCYTETHYDEGSYTVRCSDCTEVKDRTSDFWCFADECTPA